MWSGVPFRLGIARNSKKMNNNAKRSDTEVSVIRVKFSPKHIIFVYLWLVTFRTGADSSVIDAVSAEICIFIFHVTDGGRKHVVCCAPAEKKTKSSSRYPYQSATHCCIASGVESTRFVHMKSILRYLQMSDYFNCTALQKFEMSLRNQLSFAITDSVLFGN